MGKLYIVTWISIATNGSGVVVGTEKGVDHHHAMTIASESNKRFKPLQYTVREFGAV